MAGRPPNSELHKKMELRLRINRVLSRLQKRFSQTGPSLRLTTQKFAEALDQGVFDSLPVSSKCCPRSMTDRREFAYYALLEAVVKTYWAKREGTLRSVLPLLEDIAQNGLKDYVVLGCRRTGFYLFLPGKSNE